MKLLYFTLVFILFAALPSHAQKIYFSDTTNTWDVQYTQSAGGGRVIPALGNITTIEAGSFTVVYNING